MHAISCQSFAEDIKLNILANLLCHKQARQSKAQNIKVMPQHVTQKLLRSALIIGLAAECSVESFRQHVV